MVLSPAAAQATTITVNSTADTLSGCTLRTAIKAANLNTPQGTCPAGQASPTVDKIDFSLPDHSTITLTSALDPITDWVNISGPGQGQLTVSGADTYHPLTMNSGNIVFVSGLTISHGLCDSAGCSFAGGAIRNLGNLTLTHVTVTQSTSSGVGGGIYNAGTMTIQNSTVSSNTATVTGGANPSANGGGIYNAGTMNVRLSTITNNTASVIGGTTQGNAGAGGIFNTDAGDLTVDRSSVTSNTATADGTGGNFTNVFGGGIVNRHNLTIARSTLSGNTSSASNGATANSASAGGISNVNPFSPDDVTVTIARSTLSDNTATVSAGPGQSGSGGLQIFAGTYTIKSSTIAHNSADIAANVSQGGTPTFKNTIVSDPEGGGSNCNGSVTTSSYDLSSDGTCGFTGTGDHLNTDPLLAAILADNGGPTETYALEPGSPAIDQGLSSGGEAVDQRGMTRPSDFPSIANAPGGDGTDVGSFELSDPTAIIDSGPSGTTNDPTPTFTFHAMDGASALQCKVDGGVFVACTSPRTTAHLADGAHTFQVRARDALGNIGPIASRSFTVKTAEVNRSGSTLVFTAAPGAKDNVKVTKPSPSTIRVTDVPGVTYTGSGIHTVAGSGCTRSGDYTANCNAAGVTAVKVTSADGIDRIRNTTALRSTLLGGPDSDLLFGGTGNDTLNGGPAADSFRGGNGNDTLLAHDLTSDTAINCDGGTNPGTADKADLDLLPKDPDAIVTGCETKTRH